jgi:hypothetical protein
MLITPINAILRVNSGKWACCGCCIFYHLNCPTCQKTDSNLGFQDSNSLGQPKCKLSAESKLGFMMKLRSQSKLNAQMKLTAQNKLNVQNKFALILKLDFVF